MVKRESGDLIVAEVRVRAIERVGEVLAAFAYAKTPLLRDADIFVPVPSDGERLADRGCSVPLILASRVAVSCAIPLHSNLIEAPGPVKELRQLPKGARAGAVADAFGGTDKAMMLNILNVVVDEVVATGST